LDIRGVTVAYLYTGVGNFIGMRWADWTVGGQVPADVLENLLNVLAHGLPPPVDPLGGGLRSRGDRDRAVASGRIGLGGPFHHG